MAIFEYIPSRYRRRFGLLCHAGKYWPRGKYVQSRRVILRSPSFPPPLTLCNLHHYWDDEFVALLETDAKSIASDLIGHISKEQVRKWQSGSPADWAVETFEVAKADAYGLLSEPSGRNTYQLTDEYVTTATDDVAQQLSKAGVRLAFVLNNALRKR